MKIAILPQAYFCSNFNPLCGIVGPTLRSLILVAAMVCATASEALPTPVATPLPGGWSLRTGVFPQQDATASFDKAGVLTLSGGGFLGTWPRGTPQPSDRARMTAAFVYKAFTSDFILTARRIGFDRGKAHPNSGSGVAVIGDLVGWDTPMASNYASNGDKPVWFRIIRKGDRVGLYEGPDGQRWMASNAGALIPGTVYAGLTCEGYDQRATAQFDNITVESNPRFTYNTTWLGNEFEGGPSNTVNASMFGLGVGADGTCITVGANGEQENEMGLYRDGKVLTYWGGDRVGATGNAIALMPDGHGLVSKGRRLIGFHWNEQNRLNRVKSEPITAEGAGEASIRGLAIHEGEVFVAARPDNAIIVLDLKNLKEKRRIPFGRPGPLAVDVKGVLWAVEEGWTSGHPYAYPYPKPFRILGLDRQTGKQVGEITGVELPSAMSTDAHGPGARLFIADNGQDQQVKIFDVSGAKPKPLGTLGAKGGVYAGTPGEMKPGKFNGLSGVGTDAKGNIYVTTAGYPYRVVIPFGMPNISQLKAFAPTAINKPEPAALWTLNCPGFNCMGAAWDAKTGDVYIGGLARYSFDPKGGLGREWRLAGTTANLRDESDGETVERTFFAAPDIAWIEGERFLTLRERTYKLDKNGNLGRIVRIDNGRENFLREQQERRAKGAADPFSLEARMGNWPAETPSPTINEKGEQLDWKRWEWVDGQGGPLDGKQQRGEYRDLTALRIEPAAAQAATAINTLDRWEARGDRGLTIQHRRFTGVKNGVPTWADSVRQFAAPGIFTSVLGLHYQADRDIMDIAGQTAENPGGHQWQIAEVIRFTTWSTKPTMGVRLVFMPRGARVPFGGEGFWQSGHHLDKASAWAVAGDIAYVPNRTGAIRAYDLNKGNMIEWMDAGPEVFATSGFFDYPDTALRAYQISPTEHFLVRQSNFTIRILAHRWNPQGANSGRLPPAPEVWAYPRDGEAELVWGGRTGVTGTVRGYQIYRADNAQGPFKKIALATGPTFRDKRPNGQPAWYRVATVNLVGEGPQSEVVCAGAAPTTAKRLVGSGSITADGFDITTRGNWQGVHGAEAAYLAQDHAPQDVTPQPRAFAAGWVTGFGPHWENKRPVSPSDDQDRLQSARVPGMRCDPKAGVWWGTNDGEIIIQDGRPRRLTLALRRTSTISIRDPETGADILMDQVECPDNPSIRYVSYLVSGRFRLFVQGEFSAVFLDPAPAER